VLAGIAGHYKIAPERSYLGIAMTVAFEIICRMVLALFVVGS
jgi:hypothetical protein